MLLGWGHTLVIFYELCLGGAGGPLDFISTLGVNAGWWGHSVYVRFPHPWYMQQGERILSKPCFVTTVCHCLQVQEMESHSFYFSSPSQSYFDANTICNFVRTSRIVCSYLSSTEVLFNSLLYYNEQNLAKVSQNHGLTDLPISIICRFQMC